VALPQIKHIAIKHIALNIQPLRGWRIEDAFSPK